MIMNNDDIINGEKLPDNYMVSCAYDLNKAVFKWTDVLNPIMLCASHRNQLYKIGKYNFMSDKCDECRIHDKIPFKNFCLDCEIKEILEHDTWCRDCADERCLNIKLFVDLGYIDHEYGEEIKSNLWGKNKDDEKSCDLCNMSDLYMTENNICMDCAHIQSKCDSCGAMCYRDMGGVHRKCRECLLNEFGKCTIFRCHNPCEDLSNGPGVILDSEIDPPDLKICLNHRLSGARIS